MTALGEIHVTRIGSIASRLVAGELEARVWGATSRGVFLHLASGWITYLSPEEIPGPLTLNLRGDTGRIKTIRNGEAARVSSQYIDFPESGLQIEVSQAVAWQATPPPHTPINLEECRARLKEVSRLVVNRPERASRTASPLFQSFLVLSGLLEPADLPGNPLFPLLERLMKAREEKAARKLIECLEALLGMGGGLTPSGDDLSIGLLITLNRWGHQLEPELDIGSINKLITQAAYSRTTLLSANLIECAAQGQANQRLILSLDGMMTGVPDSERCAGLLAGWGNTSGLDALVGMGVVIGW